MATSGRITNGRASSYPSTSRSGRTSRGQWRRPTFSRGALRGWRKAVALAAVILGVGLGVAGAADAAPALWVVRDADSEIYLFGTLHALSPDARWRTPLYDRALANADTVWFEADLQSGDRTRCAC